MRLNETYRFARRNKARGSVWQSKTEHLVQVESVWATGRYMPHIGAKQRAKALARISK